MKTPQRAVITHLDMTGRDWYAIGATENLVPILLCFANRREYKGGKFGDEKAKFSAKIGDFVVVAEEGKKNPLGHLLATAWAPADKADNKADKRQATGAPKPAKAQKKVEPPAPTPLEKIVKDDTRMLQLRLAKVQPGENPQLFYGKLEGRNGGLRAWLQKHGIPEEDFTFKVEKEPKVWVPADKEILGRLTTEVVEKELEPASAGA